MKEEREMKNKKGIAFIALLFPMLFGATYPEEVHPLNLCSTQEINEKNCDNISKNYGYFAPNTEFPTLVGNSSTWKMKLRFYRNTTSKIQIRLLYCYGQMLKFNSSQSGCNYYSVYESGFTSGNIGTYFDCSISLSEALKDHGISTTYLNNIYTNYFYLGFYIDEHGTSSQGKFYYITIPTTYSSGQHYRFNIGHYTTNYLCYPSVDNGSKQEFHKRVFFGGEKWSKTVECVGGGSFADWRDFQNESRGEIDQTYFEIPLKMEFYGLTRADQPTFTVKDGDANLFIYEGYEYYNLGELSTGIDGKKGYKIPLKVVKSGKYYVLRTRVPFYVTPDYRNIYFRESIPESANNRRYSRVSGYVPIPAITGNAPVTFKYQIELLNAGPLGLVDITAAFSYTKSKNYFGSHSNSDYYVEEVIL